MKKDELEQKVINLLDTIEEDERDEFDDTEIEDLVVEAGIPTSRSCGNLNAVPGQGRN